MAGPPSLAATEVIYRTRDHRACEERLLVLRALGIDGVAHYAAGEFAIEVPAELAPRARAELLEYSRENVARARPAARPLPRLSDGWTGVIVYAIVLMGFAVLQNQNLGGIDWLEAGRMQAGLVRDGEWWRTLTALTLHADLGHILGNLLFGAVFGLFAGQLLGQGVAWSSILVTGALGNALNAMIQPDWHRAIGASTAVFAALGLLAAFTWRRRGRLERWAHRWAPLVGGVLLLGWIGTGDENTDVAAHLTGFLAGLGCGLAWGELAEQRLRSPPLQAWLGSAALVLLASAWSVALLRCGC